MPSSRRSVRLGLPIAAALVAIGLAAGACTPLPRRAYASVRLAEYLASQRELPSDVSNALESGHLLLGMDPQQVWVVLGDPVSKKQFSRIGAEVWIYRAGRLHQDPLHTHGNEPFRVVFVDNRLVLIETF